MENIQIDNNEEEAGFAYLEVDILGDIGKKSFFGKTPAFFQKCFCLLVSVLSVIAILSMCITYTKETIDDQSIGTTPGHAILITGGYRYDMSGGNLSELFLPWLNTTCELPPLPDQRYHHVQSGKTLCGGGWKPSTERSCLQWSVQQGEWVTLPLNLTERRYESSILRVSQDNSLVIMGGGKASARETSETISSDRDSTSSSFKMEYVTM